MKCINTQLFTARTSNAVFASALALMLTLSIASAHMKPVLRTLLASMGRKSSSMSGHSAWKTWAMAPIFLQRGMSRAKEIRRHNPAPMMAAFWPGIYRF